MKLAVQIGLPWLVGVVATIGVGFFVWLAFAVGFLPGVLFTIGALVVVMMGIGLAVVEGHWAWRIGWGALVAVFGFAGVTFTYAAIDDERLPSQFAWVLVGLPFAVVAALLARNLFARLAGASVLVVGLVLVPGGTYGEFVRMWSGLHF